MVIDNDVDNAGGGLIIKNLSESENAVVSIIDNQISYNPNSNFIGTDSITYTVCDVNGFQSTATVYITVLESDCTLNNIMGGISPNNDNKNDFFRIPALNCGSEFRRNMITIYNRWGNIVYQRLWF